MNKKKQLQTISIIVCTYNRAEMLSEALESLIRQETGDLISYDIIVVDDNSSDGTRKVVHEYIRTSSSKISYVSGKGLGIAAARNTGLDHRTGDWTAFFDDDQIAESTWLLEMVKCAENTSALCIGGKRLVALAGDNTVRLSDTERRLLGEIDLGVDMRKCLRKEFPAAGNILLSSQVFDITGGFDESLLNGGEDIEFAARLRKTGVEAWYTPDAIVYHVTPIYRMQRQYLEWASLRAGENFAHRDHLEWGLARTGINCLARIGQASIVRIPVYLWSWIDGDDKRRSEMRLLILRAYAYTCKTLNLFFPHLFPMNMFFKKLEFRSERDIFHDGHAAREEVL